MKLSITLIMQIVYYSCPFLDFVFLKHISPTILVFHVILIALIIPVIKSYSDTGSNNPDLLLVGTLIFNIIIFVVYITASFSNYNNPKLILEFQSVSFSFLMTSVFLLLAKPIFLHKTTSMSLYLNSWYIVTLWDALASNLISRTVMYISLILVVPSTILSFSYEQQKELGIFQVIRRKFETETSVNLDNIFGISWIRHTNGLVINNFLRRLKKFLMVDNLYVIKKKKHIFICVSLHKVRSVELLDGQTKYSADKTLVVSYFPKGKNLNFTEAKQYRGIITIACIYIVFFLILLSGFSRQGGVFNATHETIRTLSYISFPIAILYLIWFHPLYKSLIIIAMDKTKLLIFDKGFMGKIQELKSSFNFVPYAIMKTVSFDWNTKEIKFEVLEDNFTISIDSYEENAIREAEKIILQNF